MCAKCEAAQVTKKKKNIVTLGQVFRINVCILYYFVVHLSVASFASWLVILLSKYAVYTVCGAHHELWVCPKCTRQMPHCVCINHFDLFSSFLIWMQNARHKHWIYQMRIIISNRQCAHVLQMSFCTDLDFPATKWCVSEFEMTFNNYFSGFTNTWKRARHFFFLYKIHYESESVWVWSTIQPKSKHSGAKEKWKRIRATNYYFKLMQ